MNGLSHSASKRHLVKRESLFEAPKLLLLVILIKTLDELENTWEWCNLCSNMARKFAMSARCTLGLKPVLTSSYSSDSSTISCWIRVSITSSRVISPDMTEFSMLATVWPELSMWCAIIMWVLPATKLRRTSSNGASSLTWERFRPLHNIFFLRQHLCRMSWHLFAATWGSFSL